MPEVSLEAVIDEREFVQLLGTAASPHRSLGRRLTAAGTETWSKGQYFQLIHEANSLETYLDDHGARFNRVFSYLRELVASTRWIALSGYSLEHVRGRLGSYAIDSWLEEAHFEDLTQSLDESLGHVRGWLHGLLEATEAEANGLGVQDAAHTQADARPLARSLQRRLPRNVGQADLVNEDQKVAGVASRYIEACGLFSEVGMRVIADGDELARFFRRHCSEAQLRVFEATIHNLQSTYDTHIQNSVLEANDERLPRLRGCVSVSLHALEASLYLTHFLERHEDEVRDDVDATSRLRELIQPAQVQTIVVNHLLLAANSALQAGLPLAEALVPTYTNVCELRLELAEGATLHARPAALIVGIVNHFGTPVQLEIADQRCNASSILELLVAVGSNPGQRVFTFHGDERPLADIQRLFESRLGEDGLDSLPDTLDYLRHR